MKNNPFGRQAGAFSIFVHFTGVVLSTMWNDLMFSCVDEKFSISFSSFRSAHTNFALG